VHGEFRQKEGELLRVRYPQQTCRHRQHALAHASDVRSACTAIGPCVRLIVSMDDDAAVTCIDSPPEVRLRRKVAFVAS
jgi:hypothetical protein